MDTVPLLEAKRRLGHRFVLTRAEGNVDLARSVLRLERQVVGASLRMISFPGLGLPIVLLELDGPHGRETIPLSPGESTFALLAEILGPDGAIETDLLDAAEGDFPDLPEQAGLAAASRSGGDEKRLASSRPLTEPDELFARIVCSANPTVATELLTASVDLLLHEVDGERGLVAINRDGLLEPLVARERDGRDMDQPRDQIPRRVFARVLASKCPTYVDDVFDDTARSIAGGSILNLGVRSFLAAPLLDGDDVTGILYLDRRDRPALFDDQARRLFEGVTARVGKLLAQTRRTEADANDLEHLAEVGLADLVGSSRQMQKLFADIRRVAKLGVDGLIIGETGTGKELVAHAIHRAGERSGRRFEAVNCGGLSEELLHSTLFGHLRGAFTGAVRDRKGVFQVADGGTLLLDELGEMPERMQTILLRTLETQRVCPLGSDRETPVDVRLLAATHRDLAEMVTAGRLREDLYYRLQAAVTLLVPPLRERTSDIPALAANFLQRARQKPGVTASRFSPLALERLSEHGWPGNVRELRNVVTKSSWLAPGEVIRAEDLVFDGRVVQPNVEPASRDSAVPFPATIADVISLEEHERRYLSAVHGLVGGNVQRMAELLGVARGTLRGRLEHLGVHKPRKRD